MLGIGGLLCSGSLAGCFGAGSGPTTTTVVTTTAPAATTTTTTLPSSTAVAGTLPTGALAFLGQIDRVPVVEPVLGSMELPPAPTGLGAVLPSVQIAYRHFGSGPNLLLVMGQRGTMTWWDPQLLSALSAQYSVTIFDLPGVGYSQSLSTAPTLASYADVTAGLIIALGLEKSSLTVVGWGLGGDVAAEADLRHPGLVTDLALVDSAALGKANVAMPKSVIAAFSSTTDTTIRLAQLLFPSTQSVIGAEWLQQIGQLAPDDETSAAIREQDAIVNTLAATPSLASASGRIKIPVQVISGSDDAVVPVANAVALAAEIPRAHRYQIANAGYASYVSNQSRFLAILSAAVSAESSSS